jgi:hypothetical protein
MVNALGILIASSRMLLHEHGSLFGISVFSCPIHTAREYKIKAKRDA